MWALKLAAASISTVILCVHMVDGISCSDLYEAQYCCAEPVIDVDTQQPTNCQPNNTFEVPCFAIDGVFCDNTLHSDLSSNDLIIGDSLVKICNGKFYNVSDSIFRRSLPCFYINPSRKYSYYVAVSLSVFFGPLGLDRFYLGFYGMGVAKLCTAGFFTIGWLVDIVLITQQIVKPADGTEYFMPYYGPRVSPLLARPDEDKFSVVDCE